MLVALFWNKQPTKLGLALAGLLLAAAAITRSDSIVALLPIMLYIWMTSSKQVKQRLLHVGVFLLFFLAPVVSYASYHASVDGNFAIDNKLGLFLYGKLAPIANCSLLPAEQKPLCDDQPVQNRPGPIWYIWSDESQ